MKNKLRDNSNPERHFYVDNGSSSISQFVECIIPRMVKETAVITKEQGEIIAKMKAIIKTVNEAEKSLNELYEQFNLIDDKKPVPPKKEPVQKFQRGDIVQVTVTSPMKNHFPTGFMGIVEYSYADAYGGSDVENYSIIYEEENYDHKGGVRANSCAWYYESELSLIKADDGTSIEQFKKKWPDMELREPRHIREEFKQRNDQILREMYKESKTKTK